MIGKQQSGRDALGSLNAAKLEKDGDLVVRARETAKHMISPEVGYGLDPKNWPPAILAALSRAKFLPKLEDPEIPTTQTPV